MDGATRAGLHDLRGLPAGFKYDFNPTDQEILKHLEDKVTGKLHPLIDKFIPTLEKENDICYTHPERLSGARKDGQIRYFFHRPGTRKRRRQTGDDGRETRWRITDNALPVSIEGTLKGFRKIFVSDGYRRHQYHLGHNEEEEGVLVVSKMFYLTQQQQYGSSIKGSTGRKTDFPKRGTLGQSKCDDGEGSLRSTIITPHHSPTPNQTETGGTEEKRMEAQITINPGAPDMKNTVSRLDKVPLSSLPPAGVQAWGSAPCTSLPKLAQPAAFVHMISASSSDHNFPSSGSCNQAGSLHQMGLPASASCRPNVEQSWPRGIDFTGNQNVDPTPAAHNQNPYWGQVQNPYWGQGQVNPEIVGAQPGNLYASPRPVGQNQEPVYPGVGIGSVSMSPEFTIRSAGSATINFNNANTNTVSAPHWPK